MSNIALAEAVQSIVVNGNDVKLTVSTETVKLSRDQVAQLVKRYGAVVSSGKVPTKTAYAWRTTTAKADAYSTVTDEDELDGFDTLPDLSDDEQVKLTVRGYFVPDATAKAASETGNLPMSVGFTSDAFSVDAEVILVTHSATRAQQRDGEPTGVIVTRYFADGDYSVTRPNGTTYALYVRIAPRLVGSRWGYMVRGYLK